MLMNPDPCVQPSTVGLRSRASPLFRKGFVVKRTRVKTAIPRTSIIGTKTLSQVIVGAFIVIHAPCFGAEKETILMNNQVQTDRFERGLQALTNLDTEAANQVIEGLRDMAPEMGQFLIEFAYGDVYSRPGLDRKSRQVATIAALTAMRSAKPQLTFHIGAALNVGLTPEEIIEVMYVTTVFAGFPRGLNGISSAREVFQTRKISMTPPSSTDKDQKDRRERGMKTMELTSKGAGERVIASLSDIAPDMADFIIDFSYGDIFSRKILNSQHKEIAMIAVCVALGSMEPQMKVHIHAALNVGCTKEQIKELMMHMAVYAGFPAALNGLNTTREVFECS
jgi:4-carboxymuconolactone decarboxylase